MSTSIADLLRTDAELDRLGSRDAGGADDLVLDGLAALICAIDDRPLPAMVFPPKPAPATSGRKACWALSVTAALMITSSGVAAAVSDDPLAPLHYVTNHVLKVGPPTGGHLPGWDVDGSMPISTVPGARATSDGSWTDGPSAPDGGGPAGGGPGLLGGSTATGTGGAHSPTSSGAGNPGTGGSGNSGSSGSSGNSGRSGNSGGSGSPGGGGSPSPPSLHPPSDPGTGGGTPSQPIAGGHTGTNGGHGTTPGFGRAPSVGARRCDPQQLPGHGVTAGSLPSTTGHRRAHTCFHDVQPPDPPRIPSGVTRHQALPRLTTPGTLGTKPESEPSAGSTPGAVGSAPSLR